MTAMTAPKPYRVRARNVRPGMVVHCSPARFIADGRWVTVWERGGVVDDVQIDSRGQVSIVIAGRPIVHTPHQLVEVLGDRYVD